MCSIMGYCSDGAAFELFKTAFDRTLSRGPDDSNIVDTGSGLLGFHRLAIMGLQPEGMQPFELDGSSVWLMSMPAPLRKSHFCIVRFFKNITPARAG